MGGNIVDETMYGLRLHCLLPSDCDGVINEPAGERIGCAAEQEAEVGSCDLGEVPWGRACK